MAQQGNMGNNALTWTVLGICGAVAATFFWLRNNQNNMPQFMQQPMQQMGNAAQQAAGAFNPQS